MLATDPAPRSTVLLGAVIVALPMPLVSVFVGLGPTDAQFLWFALWAGHGVGVWFALPRRAAQALWAVADRKWGILGALIPFAASVYVGLADGAYPRATEWMQYAGLLLFMVGHALVAAAIGDLGKNFLLRVQVARDHKLVTDGIYRFVRHPRYLGGLVVFASACLVASAPEALIFVALFAVFYYLPRIRDEESMMSAVFGPAWKMYALNTKSKLLPGVW